MTERSQFDTHTSRTKFDWGNGVLVLPYYHSGGAFEQGL